MYRVSAGIEARSPGYKEILIQPHITDRLTYSKASFESMYGTISSGWERKDGKIIIKVKIPANTNALILLPSDDPARVSEDGVAVTGNKKFKSVGTQNEMTAVETGSGEYVFEIAE
jgi:alpha-L-rhamnosidase